MVITVAAYVMMAIFMYIIMKKKMSPFTALVLIPLIFAIILVATGQVQDVNIGTLIRQGLFGNNSKDLTGWGQQALGALIGLILASLLNLFFFRSSMVEWIMSGISLIIFIILTIYDTQKLKRMYDYFEGQSALEGIAILGALELYLDFINIFLDILRLFGSGKD